MAKTFEQVIGEMTTKVNTNLGSQDTRTGTVLREGFLAPVAEQLVEAYTRTDTVEANQTISAPSAISEAAMDAIAANFGLSRFIGTAASGTVRFFRFQAPSSPISIPAGTIVSSSDIGDTMKFRTLASVSLSASSEQDPVTDAYYVDSAVIATATGAAGNAAADTVTIFDIVGVDSVTNQNEFSGGKDKQTNAELAQLIISRAQGNYGTRSGYETAVRSNFSIDDIDIITPNDYEAARDQYGGELDLTILSGNSITTEESTPSITTTFTPSWLPLIEVVEIVGINTSDSEVTLVPNTDYETFIDYYSSYNRSYKERSRIDFHVTSFSVKPSSSFTIRYKNCEIIRTIQSFLDNPDNYILGSDVLVKLAIKKLVNVAANIRIIPGYDPTTVQDNAQAAVVNYFNNFMLGNDVQVSDVITVIGKVDGVDSVDLSNQPLEILALAETPTEFVQEILANRQEYLRSGTVSITAIA